METDLALTVAARERDESLVDVPEETLLEVRTALHHEHLPRLADAGLIERGDETVAATDHPLYDDPEVRHVLRETDGDDESVDALFEALGHERRCVALATLADLYQPIAPRRLAVRVAAVERDRSWTDVADAVVDRVHASLVHVHLPVLESASLVARDAETDRIEYEGHELLRTRWLTGEFGEPDETDGDAAAVDQVVQTLEGREAVVSTGQSLCERADEELFMLFTTTGLLERGCVARMRDAVERGVDVYLGSPDPRVREMVREEVPSAVVWEAERDWMNLPPAGGSVGRLVFADREAVMVGTLADGSGDGATGERAILGAGRENGLVLLLAELVEARLDHLAAERDRSPLAS